MEGLFGVIVIVFIIIVNIAKAKKQQKAKEAASPLNAGRKAEEPFRAAPETEPERTFSAPVTPDLEGCDPCHAEQLSGMPPKAGDEGFDPCHEEPLFTIDAAAAEVTDAEQKKNAQELLRGIIFSEILGRKQPLRK